MGFRGERESGGRGGDVGAAEGQSGTSGGPACVGRGSQGAWDGVCFGLFGRWRRNEKTAV